MFEVHVKFYLTNKNHDKNALKCRQIGCNKNKSCKIKYQYFLNYIKLVFSNNFATVNIEYASDTLSQLIFVRNRITAKLKYE